jgi:iron complex outermembrane receptor protein
VLVFSAVSFETTQVKVTAESTYTVVLPLTSATLGDVVVVGYGKSSRKSLTSAITTVKPEDLNKGAIGDVDSSCKERLPDLMLPQVVIPTSLLRLFCAALLR